jgi:hypothetical protein
VIDVNVNYELYDYVLFVDGKNTGEVSQLAKYEAQQINYAFGINRSNKRYVLKSDIDVARSNVGSTLILPKG